MSAPRRLRLQAALVACAVAVGVLQLAGRTGHDTVLRLGLHPGVAALLVALLLGAALVLQLRGPRALPIAVVGAVAVVGASAALHHVDPMASSSVTQTTGDGRYTVVAVSDGVGATFWLEENRGLLVRRVPLGCSGSDGWRISASQGHTVRVDVNPVFSDGDQRSVVIDAAQAMRQGGVAVASCH